MTCDRCGRPIKPGEDYDVTVPDSLSGARPTSYTHKWRCKPPAVRPSPISR